MSCCNFFCCFSNFSFSDNSFSLSSVSVSVCSFSRWFVAVSSDTSSRIASLRPLSVSVPFPALPLSAAGNPGQDAFTPDKAPQLIIDWEVPNPVDPNYPLDETTINLRTIIETNKDGLLRFHAIFADGVAQPSATVTYKLNDSSKDQNGEVVASPSYKYPDSTDWNSQFPARATKYKDILGNWQTLVPFTNPDFNTNYYYTVNTAKDGVMGKSYESDSFLIYKVKQYWCTA